MLSPALPLPAQPLPAETLSDEAQLSLLTILPGDEVYSLWGHSAFRVYDPVQGIDATYNYGTFDFGNPVSFTLRFTYGRLDYWLSTNPYPRVVAFHRTVTRRPIIEQVLNLNADQRRAVFAFLQHNALPENRTYRYDFLYDNCSTRLRAVLEEVLGDAVHFAPEPDPQQSFRQLVDPYVASRPFLDLGIDLLFGQPTDQVPMPRQAAFLPFYLMASFDHATVTTGDGVQPLVARRDTVFWIEGAATVDPARPWPSILGWLLLGLALALTHYQARRDRLRRHRRPDALLLGLIGVVGLLLTFMWFASEHTVTNYNWNLILWAWPTHLVAAVALAWGTRSRWLQRYLLLTVAVLVIALAGWFAWPQALPAALIPLLLLLAVRCAWQAFSLRRPAFAQAP